MKEFVILTESTCDLPPEMAEEMDIKVLRLHVLLEGLDYENYLDGRELPFKTLYDSMRAKKLPSTSQVIFSDFLKEMEPVLESGKDILYIGFSGTMSGTLSSGKVAAEELLKKYPQRRIECIDSLSASMGEGLLVCLCAKKKEEGASLDEVLAYGKDCVAHMTHLFTVNDLMHVMRSGRATKSSAIIGSVLGMKPVMNVNMDGLMDKLMVVRGRKSAMKKMVEMTAKNIQDKTLPIFIGHGDCLEDAEKLRDMLKAELSVDKIYINYIGAVCGCHAGPDVLAVFYYGKNR